MFGYTDYAYRAAVVPQGAGEVLGPLEALCGELSPAVRVLEVSCGQGFFSGWFAARGCQVVAIDERPAGLDLASRAYPTCRFEQDVLEPDLLARLGEAPFDLVVATGRLDRVDDPAAFVRAAFDALRPGGRLVCTAPAVPAFARLTRLPGGNPVPGATQRWGRRPLSRMLADAGFEQAEFRSIGRVPFAASGLLVAADRPLTATRTPGEDARHVA